MPDNQRTTITQDDIEGRVPCLGKLCGCTPCICLHALMVRMYPPIHRTMTEEERIKQEIGG